MTYREGHVPSQTPYGRDLAERIAKALQEGQQLAYRHAYYCGTGLACVDGQFIYDELEDGRFRSTDQGQAPLAAFNDVTGFTEWLAAQSDHSLARFEMENDWFHGNQTVTEERLRELVGPRD